MKFGKVLIFSMAIFWVAMIVCPVVVSQLNTMTSDSHCGSMGGDATTDTTTTMQCCYREDAVPVSAIHAPPDLPVLQGLPVAATESHISFDDESVSVLYHDSGEHLAKLSILRV